MIGIYWAGLMISTHMIRHGFGGWLLDGLHRISAPTSGLSAKQAVASRRPLNRFGMQVVPRLGLQPGKRTAVHRGIGVGTNCGATGWGLSDRRNQVGLTPWRHRAGVSHRFARCSANPLHQTTGRRERSLLPELSLQREGGALRNPVAPSNR